MRRRSSLYPVLVLIPVLCAPAARAEEPGALVAEVAALNRSLNRVVDLLQAGVANQKIDVLLRRIELKERRIAPLERRLRNVQDEMLNIRAEVVRYETMKERAEGELLEYEREGDEGAMSEARYMIRDLEQAITAERAKLDELERRVPLLENELADGRDEIAILDEKLEELLE